MNSKKESVSISYTPIEWIYREVAAEEIQKGTVGKIFYFNPEEGIYEAEGRLLKVEEVSTEGVFLVLDSGKRIRMDRIITLFGKPGAAYEAYDAYANACLDCMGGYEKDE